MRSISPTVSPALGDEKRQKSWAELSQMVWHLDVAESVLLEQSLTVRARRGQRRSSKEGRDGYGQPY